MKRIYGLLSAVMLLVSCASSQKAETNLSAEDLYNKAFENLEKTRYKSAAEGFEQLETEHPYSRWAVKAKLMGAYAYYKDESYDDAVLALDRFIKYHPGNKDVPYAYYLKGMCYYDQISAADKDQKNTQLAEEAFSRLIMLYPDSKYTADARNKINLTEDYKAGQEMIIGRYYLNNGNYLSALNRFNVVLENYQTTVQIEEALYRQVEIYGILGLNNYADGYYKILKNNYPKGKWTQKAEAVMQKIGKLKKENKPQPKATPTPQPQEPERSLLNKLSFGWLDSQPKATPTPQPQEPERSLLNKLSFGWLDSQPKVVAVSPLKDRDGNIIKPENKGTN